MARTPNLDAWEKNHWVSNFQRSAETKRFLQEQNDELKGLLSDLGLVKP